jgi:hypothetical protein
MLISKDLGGTKMNNVSAINETAAIQQNWCYTAKAPETAGSILAENGVNQALLMAPKTLNIQPYQFTTALKPVETDKQLQVTRMMAFGRSFSWS